MLESILGGGGMDGTSLCGGTCEGYDGFGIRLVNGRFLCDGESFTNFRWQWRLSGIFFSVGIHGRFYRVGEHLHL